MLPGASDIITAACACQSVVGLRTDTQTWTRFHLINMDQNQSFQGHVWFQGSDLNSGDGTDDGMSHVGILVNVCESLTS